MVGVLQAGNLSVSQPLIDEVQLSRRTSQCYGENDMRWFRCTWFISSRLSIRTARASPAGHRVSE